MRRKKLVGIGLVLILLVTVVGCSSNDSGEPSEPTELYVKLPDGKADVFVLDSEGEVITYKEQVEAAKFTNLNSGEYELVVGKIGYSLFRKTVTVEGSKTVEADLSSASNPPVTLNISTTDETGSKLSDFTVEVYKNETKVNSFNSINQEAAVKVWPGVICDYQVKRNDFITYKQTNLVYFKDSGSFSMSVSSIPNKQKLYNSGTKTVDLGTLADNETAIVGVSYLNFNPTDNTAVSGTVNVNYSQPTTSSSSFVKLNSKQQTISSTEDLKNDFSQQIRQPNQAKKILDKKMRTLEQEMKHNSQLAINNENIQADFSTSNLSTGTERSFYVTDSLNNSSYSQITATLKRQTDNVYIFVENGENIDSTKLDNLASNFSDIYTTNMNYFADHSYNYSNYYDIDKNGRPIVLITDLQHLSENTEGTIGGFFSSLNYFDEPNSNQADMMYINSYIVKEGSLEANHASSVLAHEFQHLIYFIEDITSWFEADRPDKSFSESWINEGFSGLAEYLNGYYAYTGDGRINDSDKGYFGTPADESLLYWNQELSDYGASNLFGLYLYDQYGAEIIKKVNDTYQAPREIISEYINDNTNQRFADVFLDWLLTNQITQQHVSKRYSYYLSDNGVNVDLNSTPKAKTITNDSNYQFDIKPNAVKYYKIEGDGSQVTLELKNFNQPAGVIIHRQ